MFVTKALAEIAPADNDSDTPNGAFDVILSAPTKDRDGDTLQPDEWKQPLPDHITFDMDHGMSVASTVGSGVPRIEEDGTLRVTGTYSSLARGQEVRALVNEGHIRTTSVAFLTEKNQKSGKPSRELLNGAFVAVPSNREAVVLSSKGFAALEEETKAGARNSASDKGHIQDAHDHLVSLGASCGDSKSVEPDKPKVGEQEADAKSIVGSVEALQDRARAALDDAYGRRYDYWGWLRGVLPAAGGGGGVVVFESSAFGDSTATYTQTYTDDGSTVTLTGTATEVDIHEVIATDPDTNSDDPTLRAVSDEDLLLSAAAIRARANLALS